MKKTPALIAAAATCLAFSFVACNKDSSGNKPNTGANIHTMAKAGYSSTAMASAVCGGWSEAGNCLRGYGDCAWALTSNAYQQLENQMPVKLVLSDDKTKLLVRYQRYLADIDDPQLDLQDGQDVPAAISQALGAASIHIEPGSYAPEFDENQYGDYELNVAVQ